MALKGCIQTFILQDTFYSYPSLSTSLLCLTEKVLFVKHVIKGKTEHYDIMVADIIGCHPGKKFDKSKADVKEISAYLCIYAYPLRTTGRFLSKQARRERNALTFVMRNFVNYDENLTEVMRWRTAILWLLRGKQFFETGDVGIPASVPSPQKLLILVNPHSGPGKAYQIFKERVIPLLAESDTQYELLITDKANCARVFVKKADLSKWSGIVVVSGDGLLYEVFNGLMERPDWQTAVKMPVGIVPGGSGNGLARAISYATGEPYDTTVVTSSVLNIVRGRISPMDLVQVQTSGEAVYSFLSVGWGLMADIDIESERLRAIGEARFTVWAVIRAIGLRKYKGRLSYLPLEGYESKPKQKVTIEPLVKRSKTLDGRRLAWSTGTETDNCNYSSDQLFRSKSFGAETSEICAHDSDKSVKLLKFSYSGEFNNFNASEESKSACTNQNGCTQDFFNSVFTNNQKPDSSYIPHNHCATNDLTTKIEQSKKLLEESIDSIGRPPSSLPPMDEPVPEDWVVIEGEFVLVYICHQTHLSSDVLFAPDAKLDDGIMWLVVIRSGVSRAQVIYFLSSLQAGDHVHFPYVDVIPIHAFRLEPCQTDGLLTVDGEVIPCGSIQGEVLPSVARVMIR